MVECTQFKCLVSEDVKIPLPVSLNYCLYFEEQFRMLFDEILDGVASEVCLV